MFKYRVIGDAKPRKYVSSDYDEGYYDDVLSPDELKMLSYCDCQDEFVEYFDKPLANSLEHNAYMHFELHNGVLYSVVEYTANRELTLAEQGELADYTSGQWSDGIGEGYEQFPCRETNDTEYYISPWHPNQTIKVEQV